MQVWPKRAIAVQRGAALAIAVAAGGLLALVFGPAMGAVGLLVGGGYYVAMTQRYRQRRDLLSKPMPKSHKEILERCVSFYRRLDDEAKARFETDVRIFMSEQTITGLAGADVSDEPKLLIAASAAMLTFGIPTFEWPRVRDIVVYPRSFDASYEDGGQIAGMVHLHGPVLFSKSDLKHGFQRSRDGHNVGIHEMAHVMDMLDGAADGIPGDLPWVSTAPWVKVVASRLSRVRRRHHRNILRDYAGTNEAELFAVAVEVFFEQPDKLRKRDPQLYKMLSRYFNQDPIRPGKVGEGG